MANQEEKIPEKDFLFNELLYAKIEYHSGSVWESYVRTIELFESMEQLDDVEIVSHFYLHLAGIFNLVNLDNQMKVCLDKLKGFKDISEETRLHSSMLLLDLYKRSENNQQVIIMAHDLYERILEMGFTTLLPEMYLLYADISVDTGDLIEAQNYLKKVLK